MYITLSVYAYDISTTLHILEMQVETENWFLVVSGAENKIVMPDDKRTSRPNLFFEWIAPLDYLVCPYTA